MRRIKKRPSPVRTKSLIHPGSIPRGRDGLAREVSRLEHMRSLIESELAVWADKSEAASERLHHILKRLEVVYQTLTEDGFDLYRSRRRQSQMPMRDTTAYRRRRRSV